MKTDIKIKKLFRERLRSEREMCGFTQKEAASYAGITSSEWSFYETGLRTPSIENFHRICYALNSSADYLLGLVEWAKEDK